MTTATAKITANWSIKADGTRTAEVDGATLVVDKPIKGIDLAWAVRFDDDLQISNLYGWARYGGLPTRYASVVRQAMFNAEEAYRSMTCKCGQWPIAEYGETCPSCDTDNLENEIAADRLSSSDADEWDDER